MEETNYDVGVITEKSDFSLICNSESFQSCECGYFSRSPSGKYCPHCSKMLKTNEGYFEVHLRPDTSVIKDKVLRNFIEKMINPYWEIGLIKSDKGFRFVDSTEFWKGKVRGIGYYEEIPFNPEDPKKVIDTNNE